MDDNRLQKLKEAYDAIPVPPDLEERVRASIRRAKEETAPAAPPAASGRVLRFLRRLGTTAAAALVTLVVLANSGADMASAMGKLPVLGAIVRVVTLRTYTDTRDGASAHVEIPQVEGGGEALQSAVSTYTDTIIAQYQADAEEAGMGVYDLDLSYETVTDNDSVFALRFNKTLIMASGSEEVKIYDVDKATGALLSLPDLFCSDSDCLSVLTEEIQSQMRQRMQDDDSLLYWLDDPDAGSWNFRQLSADADFYFDADNQLVIVFDEGEVGPMSIGVQEFTIPARLTASLGLSTYFPG